MCLIRVSKHLETMKALGLRPRAFISFSVLGYRDEILALVVDISRPRWCSVLSLWMRSYIATTQMKVTEEYFNVVLFITMYN